MKDLSRFKDIDVNDFLNRLMDMLEEQLGKNTEIVLHNLCGSYEHTIIDIRNNEVTGREVGGIGSNLGLEVLKGNVEKGDKYNYITKLRDGRHLRSSSLYFRNKKGKIIGSLCLNTDITNTLKLENDLKDFNKYDRQSEVEEIFASNIGQLLNYLIQKAQEYVNVPVEEMTRDDKIKFVKYLDEKGAFQITKSSERIQEYLIISRCTLYSYLNTFRK